MVTLFRRRSGEDGRRSDADDGDRGSGGWAARDAGIMRGASSNVSIGVLLLLACMCIAIGMGAALLAVRVRMPSAFVATTQPGSVAVESTTFDDARSVVLNVVQGASATMVTPVDGVITRWDCAAGKSLESGGSPVSINETPIPALYMGVPPYRDFGNGVKGADAAALNAELRRLGYAAPDGDTVTWDTITAFNAFADAGGAAPANAGNGWAITRGMFIWIPSEQVTIAQCLASYGTSVHQGDGLFVSAAQPVSATVVRSGSTGAVTSGNASEDVVAGERTLMIAGAQFTLADDVETVDDADVLAAIAASAEYRTALSSAASGGSDGAGGSGGSSGANADGLRVTYRWALSQPLTAIAVPPAALYDIAGQQACLATGGETRAVSIVASQLGKTIVTADGPSFTHVDVPASTSKACR